MSLSNDGLQQRTDAWMTTKVDAPLMSTTDNEKSSVQDNVGSVDEVHWGAEMGARFEGKDIIAGVHQDLDPTVINVFFKGRTKAMRCLNVHADEAIAEEIYKVLESRYSSNGMKIEYYGPRNKSFAIDISPDMAKKVSPFCMSCIIKEGPFSGGTAYMQETVKLIDESLQNMDV